MPLTTSTCAVTGLSTKLSATASMEAGTLVIRLADGWDSFWWAEVSIDAEQLRRLLDEGRDFPP